ncbi:glycogen/starch/alpha-glucan phosphorylase [Halovulum dunhuangense]|uniref:Alpha-1,4 glucan phosphorylase n=1 Tax=Halovulum dunhuangense TaxID=1505036 RepID=A0A849L4B5_9RHOB|nr:glycogen/starch/alpha-glucan phosphorylase [Halovulum dunhuangense]NNU80991.1 glycogen/starch/alpha-glucan phosphorylase [Halovulum dunhuangense]
MTRDELKAEMLRHLQYSFGKDPAHAQVRDWRMALSMAVRDRIVEPWFAATRATYSGQHKRVYYLSLEFLIGRLLEDAIVNLGLGQAAREACAALDLDFEAVMTDEPDAALGNGGLGRLAACFLDSLSTLSIPAHGYGIRYEHGLFKQSFHEGRQVEQAEDWLNQPHAWEFERAESSYEIGFWGEVEEKDGRAIWHPGDAVLARAYDTPVIGWQGRWANTLRLWGAKPTKLFDLARFNTGDFTAAAQPEEAARTISRVLYPDDTTDAGRELRLKQEYFFAAASIRDILRRYTSEYDDIRRLPHKVAIQLNDTHPAIAGPELVRILHDEHGLAFDEAVQIASATLNYTNHTLLPEALERWSEGLMRHLLPRHMRLIEQIDDWHARTTKGRTLSAIDQGSVKMGELSFMLANRVNGVSALHTGLMKKTVFAELDRLHPDRIVNQTNGVTPRRWLLACNPGLSGLVTETIGTGWEDDLERLGQLDPHVSDAGFRARFAAVKRANKAHLSDWIGREMGISVDPDAMFDVQIKRIHEYKRQLMNVLDVIATWHAMRGEPGLDWVPRVKIFGGKAAPGYQTAKEIIRLINDVATVVNSDPAIGDRLKVVYPPNYNVSMAERLIPAADLSEQISTAGKEASGTGNMKFALNGAPTIGTLDGANVEIRERVGAGNFFLFGLTAEEAMARREVPDHAGRAIAASPELAQAIAHLERGTFSPGEPDRYRHLAQILRHHDYFLVCSDFAAYHAKQRAVDAVFRDRDAWVAMAARNTARSGWFSSDRTIRSYAAEIWDVTPVEVGPGACVLAS